MQCCGAIGPLDYHQSAWFNSTTDSAGVFVPTSCCKNFKPLSDPRNKEDLQGRSKYEADENAGGRDTEGKGGVHGSLSSGRLAGRSHLSADTDIRYRDHRKWKRDEDGKRSLKPRSPVSSSSSSSLIPKDYLCQLEAMRLQFPNSQQEFVHVHTQVRGVMLVSWIKGGMVIQKNGDLNGWFFGWMGGWVGFAPFPRYFKIKADDVSLLTLSFKKKNKVVY